MCSQFSLCRYALVRRALAAEGLGTPGSDLDPADVAPVLHARLPGVGTDGECSTRHHAHVEPSFLELRILWRGVIKRILSSRLLSYGIL
jgi:hypothetical protein